MRRITAQIEALGPAQFILLIGLVGSVIQGVPRLLVGETPNARLQIVPFLFGTALAVMWWTAALLLWWVAVRRRQSSLWSIALQVTLGLAIADVLAAAVGVAGASIETHGRYVTLISHQVLNVLVPNLAFVLLRCPVWFFGSVAGIALGRNLTDEQQPLAAPESSLTHPGSIS